MKAAAKAGKLAGVPADLRKARVQGDAGPSAPVAAPLLKEIPEVLVDKCSRRLYVRGRFLSKAGVVKCFEISDQNTKEVFAAKIVPKSLLTPSQKKKLSKEISIHRSLSHQHVVGFHSVFEDSEFVFVILELCRERSLLELHKRRKGLTQLEARYYLRQIILGCQYLHHNQVIHGNLRLSNVFLNEDMEVKIAPVPMSPFLPCPSAVRRVFTWFPSASNSVVSGLKCHLFT
uniref:Serine/threonine-protein kinase PLK1 n=1 Tax=Peromyscus maniculatus bairdii TaxID=230844 RepID=A0A8C8W649_PERMB